MKKPNPRAHKQHLLKISPPFLQLLPLNFSLPFSQIFFQNFVYNSHTPYLQFQSKNIAVNPCGMSHLNKGPKDVSWDQGVPTFGAPLSHAMNKFTIQNYGARETSHRRTLLVLCAIKVSINFGDKSKEIRLRNKGNALR